ncbi:uncharacterized protein [Nicotiana tomentosiformis]|uniref:uncharacterized protein n=1 Tax=Nicotiana tomentosiformis TaxID=4098 RepID=UPI00051BFDAC|nr:uncharacterized protein LOC104095199 [Nicotiana tomentosiformis]
MALQTQTMLVGIAISFFLSILPSKAYEYSSTSLSPSPSLDSSSDSSSVSSSSSQIQIFDIPTKPLVAKASDIPSLVKASMVGTMTKTEEFIKNVIDKRLANKKMDSYHKDCLETCKEVYEDAMDSMTKATEDVNLGNYFKANVDISAMTSFIETCKDCAAEMYGDDPAFQKFQNWAEGIASDCLDKVAGASS